MSKFDVKRYFSLDDLESLYSYYNEQETLFAHQDYNLFGVEKRRCPHDTWPEQIHYLNKVVDKHPLAHYFLKYIPNSFTRMHVDNSERVNQTVVTVIDQSQLIGGETLMMDTYERKPRIKTHYAKRGKDKPAPYGKDIMPVVVPTRTGDSIIYDSKVSHGVCKVHTGHRIVLISWYE